MQAIILFLVLICASARPQQEFSYLDENGIPRRIKLLHGLEGLQPLDHPVVPAFTNIPNTGETKYVGPPALVRFTPEGALADTPEVAAAKQEHERAHSAVRSFLPLLPQEEPIATAPIIPSSPVITNQYIPNLHHHNPLPGFPFAETHPSEPKKTFTQFAEEIPRSSFGETPEVAAAREAHIRNYLEVRANLPELPSTTGNPVFGGNNVENFLQDTPDVAAAKAKHAAAVAAIRNANPTSFHHNPIVPVHSIAPIVVSSRGVEDTPEVAAAKAQHLAAHAAAQRF